MPAMLTKKQRRSGGEREGSSHSTLLSICAARILPYQSSQYKLKQSNIESTRATL